MGETGEGKSVQAALTRRSIRLNKAGRKSGGLRKPQRLGEEELCQVRRSHNWDADDGKKVICLICGVKMWGLGPIDRERRGHLYTAHEKMTPAQYVAYCEQ